MIPACPSLMYSFNSRDNMEGTNYLKFVFDFCVYMYVLCFCRVWFCGLT